MCVPNPSKASPISFPGVSPPVLFKDVKAQWKSRANKPNAKSTAAKTATLSALETRHLAEQAQEPGSLNIQRGPQNQQCFTQEQEGDSDNIHTYSYKCELICKLYLNLVVSPDFNLSISARGLSQATSRKCLCDAAQWWSREKDVTIILVFGGLINAIWIQEEWSKWPAAVGELFLYVFIRNTVSKYFTWL